MLTFETDGYFFIFYNLCSGEREIDRLKER